MAGEGVQYLCHWDHRMAGLDLFGRQGQTVGVQTLLGGCLNSLDGDYEAWREAVASALEIVVKELPVGMPALSSMTSSKVLASTRGMRFSANVFVDDPARVATRAAGCESTISDVPHSLGVTGCQHAISQWLLHCCCGCMLKARVVQLPGQGWYHTISCHSTGRDMFADTKCPSFVLGHEHAGHALWLCHQATVPCDPQQCP